MKFIEYGKENSKTLILLHGGGLGPWSYAAAAERLADEFHVIVPILDGHGDADHHFEGIGANADRIIEYIDRELGGRALLISGLSLGGQILCEMLARRPDICEVAIIESASVIPMADFIRSLIKPSVDMSYPLINKKWFARLQFKYLRIRDDLFDDYYRDTSRIRCEDMSSFIGASISYSLPESISKTKAHVIVVAGSREEKTILRSGKMICNAIPSSELVIKEKLRHGEWSINLYDEYADYVKSVLLRH